MKYEITKGSKKDFEQAPEWAMVLLKHENGRCVFAESKSKGAKRTEMYSAGYCIIVVPNEYEIIAERRPITEPVWDGEGLPPIGCVCEYRGNDTSWGEVRIIGHDEGKVVFKPSGEDYYGITPSHKAEFIPISSPEDVARDEATKAMNEVWREHAGKEHNGKLFSIYEIIYEGIAAGKIPGVKLE